MTTVVGRPALRRGLIQASHIDLVFPSTQTSSFRFWPLSVLRNSVTLATGSGTLVSPISSYVSTEVKTTLSLYFSATALIFGNETMHPPHQVAQKSRT